MTASLATQQPAQYSPPLRQRDAPGPVLCRKAFFRDNAPIFFLKRLLPRLALFILMAGLSACVSLLPDPGPAPARLQLTPVMPDRVTGETVNKQLAVALPLAGNDISTDGIALVFNDREVRYLAGARWIGPAPQIFQLALIDSLSVASGLRGVAGESAGIVADARLLCDLRQFSLHYADPKGTPTAVLTANFRLLNLHNGSIMDTRSVSVTVPSAGRDTAALAAACETALSRCLAEVTPWVARTVAGAR